MRNDVDQRPLIEIFARFCRHKVNDIASDDVLAAVAKLIEPAIADVDDTAGAVDRMQHRRRVPVEIAVMLLDAELGTQLRIRNDRTHAVAVVRLALNNRIRETDDGLAGLRDEFDRDIGQSTGAAQ